MGANDAQFLLTDPMETLQRVLEREVRRAEQRRNELAEIGNALLQLERQGEQPTGQGSRPVWEPVSAEIAPSLIGSLLDATDGPLRTCVVSVSSGPGLQEPLVTKAMERLARGGAQRAVYPIDLWDDDSGRRWMRDWAEAGEEQRICVDPPSDFAIFGDGAVMAVADWADPDSDYVLIRDQMIVQAFTQLFDRVYDHSLPVPGESEETSGELRLLRLLGSGLKDEAIARYLGVSLRTVRRHIATLMARHGAQTRFQLGVAAAASGLVDPPRAGRDNGSRPLRRGGGLGAPRTDR